MWKLFPSSGGSIQSQPEAEGSPGMLNEIHRPAICMYQVGVTAVRGAGAPDITHDPAKKKDVAEGAEPH